MAFRADILAIAHSPADKATAAAAAEDLDSLRSVVLSKHDDLVAATAEYKKRLPVAHAGIAAINTSVAAHL